MKNRAKATNASMAAVNTNVKREREGMNGFDFLLSFTTQIRPEHLKLLVRYVS